MKIKSFAILVFLLLVSYINAQVTDHWETIIYATDEWHYFPGNSDPGYDWNTLSFSDISWLKGNGGIGYADDDDNTVISTVISLFMRIEFTVFNITNINEALFHIDYDDGFVAYINGTEIARSGVNGNPPAYDATAVNHEAVMKDGGIPEEFIFDKSVLVNGKNILAVEVHNQDITSSDMSAIPFLSVGIADQTLTYRNTPEWFKEPFVFKESNIPIIIIDTKDNASIADEPKTDAYMKIINKKTGNNQITDTANIYDGNIGIEIRGSYSASLPQKPYGLETRDSSGENNNVSLLEMPEENDWILLANYNEKSFMRNTLMFHLFNLMGHYAPRTEWCEVVLNGRYDGIYVFTEKLKRDKNRIDIARLDTNDISGDELTGGYIFKIDYYNREDGDNWISNYSPIDKPGAQVHFVYHDPKPDELKPEQKEYIQDYVDEFETVLYSNDFRNTSTGYYNYIDVPSFIDYFIIGEVSRNTDAYKKSRFFYKDKNSNGGHIISGPVWDFDWALKNLNDNCGIFNNTDGSGWAYLVNSAPCGINPIPTSWMVRLMQDTTFQNELGFRYHTLRETILSDTYIHHYIDSVQTLLYAAQERHYTRWPILGIRSGAAEVDGYPDTYTGEVNKLKTWLDIRLAWLDTNMPENKEYNSVVKTNLLTNNFNTKIFPNPTQNYVWIESNSLIQKIELYSISGKLTDIIMDVNSYTEKLNLQKIEKGIYIIQVYNAEGYIWKSKLLKK